MSEREWACWLTGDGKLIAPPVPVPAETGVTAKPITVIPLSRAEQAEEALHELVRLKDAKEKGLPWTESEKHAAWVNARQSLRGGSE